MRKHLTLGLDRQMAGRTDRVQKNNNILRRNTISNEHPVSAWSASQLYKWSLKDSAFMKILNCIDIDTIINFQKALPRVVLAYTKRGV